MSKIMKPDELRRHIKNFLSGNRFGSLGTCMNNMPRSSPVQYFLGQDLEIYILSAGGTKFQYIQHNPNVCLLVNTEYTNYTRIEGVQVFGRAVTSEEEPRLLHEAMEFCPDCHTIESLKDTIKVIKIIPEEIIYLNSRETGDRTKQVLTKEHITRQKTQFDRELVFQ
ncbi:MAG TPA: pyridoxamine 5'-phosphate oxidase family protein [Clostridiales bacterium]|nr:pyridoxamine 5'-phosphate oxidase family protein [Clostridiales bacterium]